MKAFRIIFILSSSICALAVLGKTTGQSVPYKPPLKMFSTTKDSVINRLPFLYQTKPKTKAPKWLKEFIVIYKQYSAVCYADSQYVKTHPLAIDSDGNVLGVLIISWEWVHREPTLPGFMIWLEKHYGK